jgi:selenocysteine lyase/cysteine desulfurase
VALVTPRHAMGTLVSFRIGGWPAADAVRELGARTFAIIRDVAAIDAIRISIGFWNTEEELERFAQGVELLASHTPESVPPRRTLAVLGSDDSPLR